MASLFPLKPKTKTRLAVILGWIVGFGVTFSLFVAFSGFALAATITPAGWFIVGTFTAILVGYAISKLFEYAYTKLSLVESAGNKEAGNIDKTSKDAQQLEPIKPELVKLIILGNEGTGKTSLLTKYIDDTFNSNYEPTIGMDFQLKTDLRVRLQLWDTAGSERFKDLISRCCNNSGCAILVYDATNPKSFEELAGWGKLLSSEVPIMVVAMKCDVAQQRKVSFQEGQAKAAELGAFAFCEASAKTGVNVDEIFAEVYRKIRSRQNFPENKESKNTVRDALSPFITIPYPTTQPVVTTSHLPTTKPSSPKEDTTEDDDATHDKSPTSTP